MGIVLMHKGHWDYGDFWPLFGLVAWGVSFLVGAAFLGPQAGKLAKLIEVKGPNDPDVAARTSRIIAVARADVVLILLVAADMVDEAVRQLARRSSRSSGSHAPTTQFGASTTSWMRRSTATLANA